MINFEIATAADLLRLKVLLTKIDTTFPIPLSEKTDIDELASKFLDKGQVLLAVDGDIPVGMIAFYANDAQTKTAYASVLGVVKTHQRRGIAKELMLRALEACKDSGMTSCVLYTHKTNIGAIAMYEKLGFVAGEDANRPDDIKFIKKI